jgi:hypothetical protein
VLNSLGAELRWFQTGGGKLVRVPNKPALEPGKQYLSMELQPQRHFSERKRLVGAKLGAGEAHRTSFVPLVALVDGRWRPSVRDLDMMRLSVAAALYIGLLLLHEQVIGVSPYPPL